MNHEEKEDNKIITKMNLSFKTKFKALYGVIVDEYFEETYIFFSNEFLDTCKNYHNITKFVPGSMKK